LLAANPSDARHAASAPGIRSADNCAPMLTHADAPHEAACFSMRYKGRERTFCIYSRLRGHEPAPVILVLHGRGGTGAGMEWLTRRGFNRIADRESAIVVYPDGVAGGWNDGRPALAERADAQNVDDLGFLRILPRAVARRFAVDPLRVYAAGISNGGMMSLRLACDAADVFAAVAAVGADFPRELAARCKPSRAISVALINGTEDPVVPWQGGMIRAMRRELGEVLSSMATTERWVRIDHCGPLRAGEKVDMQADDQTLVIPHTARCVDDTEVQLHEVQGGGHTWPSGEQYLPEALVGRVSREIDANEVIWNFLVQHRLNAAAEETKL